MGILNKIDFKEIDLAKQIINYKKMEKLTLEMCFKYPNAKFRELYEGKWDIHNSVIDYAAYLSNHEPEDLAERFKLVLRPLSSLTDEEKEGLTSYMFDGWDEMPISCFYLVELFAESLADTGDGNDNFGFDWNANDYKKLIDKLRELNIDIDNLKEKGVAVYE